MREEDRPRELRTGCLHETIVSKYVEGSLPAGAAREVAAHTESCADCRELIGWMQGERLDGFAITQEHPVAGATGDDAGALFDALCRDRRDLTGELISEKYRLGPLLGSGGMGVVYEAVNTWTERRVALKLLHPWFTSDAETVDRFRREAKSAGRVAHPSIVEVLDLGRDARDGSLYLVQEFLTGQTLRQHLEGKAALPPAEVAAVLTPIMEALAAAHQAGVVHRDVKPENIVLSVDRRGQPLPKLIDFGISKIIGDDVAHMLETGRAVGTPLYMAPEQLRAAEAIDGRADVWAVGVVMFELLAGQRPFAAPGPAEATVLILTTDAPALRSVAPQVSVALERVVARALARKREERWATMTALLEAFAAALAAGDSEGPAWLAPPETATATVAGETVTPLSAPTPAAGAAGRPRRPIVGLVAVIVAALAAAAAIAGRLYRPHAPAEATTTTVAGPSSRDDSSRLLLVPPSNIAVVPAIASEQPPPATPRPPDRAATAAAERNVEPARPHKRPAAKPAPARPAAATAAPPAKDLPPLLDP